MNVGLLTVHQSTNSGASLQAYALYKTLEKLGYEPEVINYCPAYFMDFTDKSNRSKRRTLKGMLKYAVLGGELSKKAAMFRNFAESRYPKMTERINSPEDLRRASWNKDIYICGSDQIWNPYNVRYDESWFFDFLPEDSIKVSYAASIGQDTLSEKDESWIAEGLRHFKAIGIREDAGVRLAYKLGYPATQCLDPTLLLEPDEWLRICRRPEASVPERYIFYYPLQANPVEQRLLAEIKHRYQLPVVSLCSAYKKPDLVDIQIRAFGPEQFLYLLSRSDVVLTNSFHGTVFSLLFQKNLVSFRNLSKNSRMESLFRLLDVHDFQFDTFQEVSTQDVQETFDRFKASYPRIAPEKEKSLRFLVNACEGMQ